MVSGLFAEGDCVAVRAISGNQTIRTIRLPVSIILGLKDLVPKTCKLILSSIVTTRPTSIQQIRSVKWPSLVSHSGNHFGLREFDGSGFGIRQGTFNIRVRHDPFVENPGMGIGLVS